MSDTKYDIVLLADENPKAIVTLQQVHLDPNLMHEPSTNEVARIILHDTQDELAAARALRDAYAQVAEKYGEMVETLKEASGA